MNNTLKINTNTKEPSFRKVALVGPTERREFSSIFYSLKNNDSVILSCFLDIDEFITFLQDTDDVPDVIIFLQDIPNRYSADEIMQIRFILPFARLLLISGPLCEGTGRTENILPVHFRCYWHQWKRIANTELVKYLQSCQGCLALPEPVAIEDFYLDSKIKFGNSLQNLFIHQKSILILGITNHYMSDLLVDFAKNEGAKYYIVDKITSIPQSLSFDGIYTETKEPTSSEFLQMTETLVQRYPSTSIRIFLFAPQVDEIEQLESIPNCEIISQPFYF